MKKRIAVVSSERELLALNRMDTDKLTGGGELIVLCDFFTPNFEFDSKRITAVNSFDLVPDSELRMIEDRADFFARHWYGFDKSFGNSISFGGLSLGVVHETEFHAFFKKIFIMIKAVLNAYKKYNPELIMVNKNGSATQYIAALSKAKKINRVFQFDLPPVESYARNPNISTRKLSEIKKKLPAVWSELSSGFKGRGKKTIFIRSRGYFENLKQVLGQDSNLNIVSLDEFLLTRLLNPLKLLKFISIRKAMRSRFKKQFNRLMSSQAFRKRFVFEGVNFSNLMAVQFSQCAERDWPEFVFSITELAKVFKSQKPALVILWEDFVPFERICALLAKQAGTKSIVLMHGVFKSIVGGSDWIRGFCPLTADKIAVWGNRFKKDLVEHGVPGKDVIVTGAPRFDRLITKKVNRAAVRRELGIKPKERVVVLASSLDFNKRDLENIAVAVTARPENRLILRPHPLEDLSNFTWAGDKVEIRKKINLTDLLHASDAIIVKRSSVGLEAMILGKPVVVYGKRLPIKSIYDSDPVLRVRDATKLENLLSDALDGGKRRLLEKKMTKFVFDATFRQDGKATARVVELIKKML